MVKRLLIIPARSGSKRIKNKNIKKFFGKPIINYSIDTAIKSNIFNKIHISTNSNKIANLVKRKGIKIDFLRDKKLSNDNIGLFKVFKYVTQKFKKLYLLYDEIWFLMPCAPLIESRDLIKASRFFNTNKKNTMIAVSEYKPPIQWAFKLQKDYSLIAINKKYQNIRSQNLNKYFYDSGTFGAFKAKLFYKNEKPKLSGFIIDRDKAIDIDNMDDWNFAKKLWYSKRI